MNTAFISFRKRQTSRGFTIVELMIAATVSTIVMATLVLGAVALQRSFAAVTDYANGQNDQMRISDYLAVDMRRAISVTKDGLGGAIIVLPNYYDSNNNPVPPTITNTMGWPNKRKRHHKHKNIVMDQTVTYAAGSTQTVKYYQGRAGAVGTDPSKFYREVDGALTVIANDVSDFKLTFPTDDGTFVTTQVTFSPRFRLGSNAAATAGTTLSQTTLLRNTR